MSLGDFFTGNWARMPEGSGAGAIYVDSASGSDANPGTAVAPKQTLEGAKAALPSGAGAAAGWFIRARGTFTVTNGNVLQIPASIGGTVTNPLTIEAWPGGSITREGRSYFSCLIQNSDNGNTGNAGFNGIWLNKCVGVRVRGIEFQGGDDIPITGTAVGVIAGQPHANACAIRCDSTTGVEISGNVIHRTYGQGIFGTAPDDVAPLAHSRTWIVANEIYDICEACVGLATVPDNHYDARGRHPIYWGATHADPENVDHRARYLVIANNIIHDNTFGKGIELGNSLQEVVISCNTIVNQGVGRAWSATEVNSNAALGMVLFGSGGTFQRNFASKIIGNIFKGSFSNAVGLGQSLAEANDISYNVGYGNLSDATEGQFNRKLNHTGAVVGVTKTGNLETQDPALDSNWRSSNTNLLNANILSYAPPTDFYGVARSSTTPTIGAVEIAGATPPPDPGTPLGQLPNTSPISGGTVASGITSTPTGDIAATNVQAALAELASEKQPISAKGAASGYAPLDASSKVPAANLPTIASTSPWTTGDTKISAQTATHADPLGGTWYLADGSATVGAPLIALLGANLPDARGRALIMKGTHVDVDTIGDNDGVATVANRRPKHQTSKNDPGHTHSDRWGVADNTFPGQNGTSGRNDTAHTIPSATTGITVGTGVATDAVDAPAYVVAGNLFYHS